MSTDTMLGNKDRGRVIDWKRVADSYRDDMCRLIAAGNAMERTLRKLATGWDHQEPIDRWNEVVRESTAAEAPICTLSSSDDHTKE